MRALLGGLIGLVIGGILAALVVLTRFGPLMNTPRNWHGPILVALFLIPALGGVVADSGWGRPR